MPGCWQSWCGEVDADWSRGFNLEGWGLEASKLGRVTWGL